MSSQLTLSVAQDFELKRAVCSYGYFLLAPNLWDTQENTLVRPFQTPRGIVVAVVSQDAKGKDLLIACDRTVARVDQRLIKQGLSRMLRLREDLSAWRRLHKGAARRGFGRSFRSPTLFEDLVKTITGCNVTWRNTMSMNRRLVQSVGRGRVPITPAGSSADAVASQTELPRRVSRWQDYRLGQSVRPGRD